MRKLFEKIIKKMPTFSCYFSFCSVKCYKYNILKKISTKYIKERDCYMKKVIAVLSTLFCLFFIGGTIAIKPVSATSYVTTSAESQVDQVQENTVSGKLIKIKDKELKTIDEYKEAYGSDSYGLTAYLLNKIRIYSIPFGFVAIIVAAIYQYVIGIRKLDVRDKGFALMIASVTLVVICQVLPLVFAIVVKGWRG